ncbi:Disease resistance protein (TIR-NBS-LRR class) [Melia azedarach]|uniref:Disease resistance protein (TIR-NBS-LRR class) n=1 Tax=Melia azedarach TaxID=155640 RepID=A0ACC1X4L9_MELAZ|nr:Disease resistance protein (TIR-NBS-LRR class) [Melia azedarach]
MLFCIAFLNFRRLTFMGFFFFFVVFFVFYLRQYHSTKQIQSSSSACSSHPPLSSASSPSLFTNTIFKIEYDVFLSFRGADTRDNFISHLYSALNRKQVKTFIDNKLITGDEISPSLLNAIKQSIISIVIFSESYASSRWCLQELVKILKCKKKYGQIVIPIFYHVDPSDVRNQNGNFGIAFSKLEERFKENLHKLREWRIALREAANLLGFDSRVIRPESELIERIVEDVVKRLNNNIRIDLDKNLVGMESHIKEVYSSLNYTSRDVNTLGIWGIGGIGKTTIAREVFNQVSSYYEGFCFMENVREEVEKIGGLAHLRWKLLSLLNDKNVKMDIPNINFDFRRLCRKKILIVFDDVTSPEQVKSLIGSFEWFMRGSLIIVTTRDKQVLKLCGVRTIYEMKELVDTDALKLFSRHAFNCDDPEIGYEELSYKVMQYCQGLPLALKVLGGVLFGKSKEEWESAISKLKGVANKDIHKVLKISYDNLDREEKNIFLDVSCFFKGESEYVVTQFLDACGFSTRTGITSLVDKGLIAILKDNTVTMHSLLQEMGKEIVRQESDDDLGKRSRLWNHMDIYEVLKYNMGLK